MSQITVISGIERRRRWTEQKKQELVAAVSAPGANVAEIARRADIRANQIYKWRRQMDRAAQGFAEVKVQPDPVPVPAVGSMIVVEFERAIVRIPSGASPGLVSAVLRSIKS
jgi:transposase